MANEIILETNKLLQTIIVFLFYILMNLIYIFQYVNQINNNMINKPLLVLYKKDQEMQKNYTIKMINLQKLD